MLYDYWFVQFDFPMTAEQAAALGNPALEGKPYKSSGGPMTHNQTLKRDIPEGWEACPLFEAMDIQYGFPFKTKKHCSLGKRASDPLTIGLQSRS